MAYIITFTNGSIVLVKGSDAEMRTHAPGVVKVEPVNLEVMRKCTR